MRTEMIKLFLMLLLTAFLTSCDVTYTEPQKPNCEVFTDMFYSLVETEDSACFNADSTTYKPILTRVTWDNPIGENHCDLSRFVRNLKKHRGCFKW